MHEILAAPEWLEALTLSERSALLGSTDSSPLTPEQAERAARKAARWRSECGLEDDDIFAECLALEGLTPEQSLRLLAEPAARLPCQAKRPPAWVEELVEAFSRPAPPLPAEAGDALGILELLRPVLARAHARVLDRLRQIAQTAAPLEPEALAASLLETLVRRLRWASERALVLELHAARLEGRLQGETPAERFGSFLSSLRQPAIALEILRRYPVLARDACRHARQWAETSLEMIERFAADRPEIVRSCVGVGGDPGALVSAEAGLSDRHAGGRSVAILSFASGFRLVYKPKPLAVDLQLQNLIAWLNERGATPSLRCLTILDRGSYGWMEHVAAHPCTLPEEVERFYRRLGAWAALFYVLEATDLHHENLIAAGEHPVPVDLETLIQPLLEEPEGGASGGYAMACTVLRSGLLPRKTNANPRFAGFDLSGMGGLGGRTIQQNQMLEEGTDRMHWGTFPSQMPAGPNVPTLNGEPLQLSEHGEAVLCGFESLYRLVWRHREEMEVRLAVFQDLPTRTLLRGTAVYAHLLNVGNHPDYLQNALDRERLYDRLWLEALRHPLLRRALSLERGDLLVGDVPRFEALPGSADLLHPAGRVESFLAAPGLERVRERLRSLDEADLERQSWLVRAAIESARPEEQRRRWHRDSLPETGPAEPPRLLEAARRLGHRLARLAVRQRGFICWFSLEAAGDSLRLEPVGSGLYSGLSGFALFYAHLACLSGDELFERLARSALGTVRQRMEAAPGSLPPLGAYSGWGGIIYTLTHLGLLWDEPALLAEAEGLVERIATGVDTDQTYDLIGGAAGSAVCLLELHRHRPSPAVLEIAVRCGEHLLAEAIEDERGWSWPAPAEISQLPLTGFGHGTAGISWALARLAHVSGDERFRDAARGALRYERSWFCPERESWPDLRKDRETSEGRPFFYAWCHGAPGIGLGRIGSLPYLDDPEILSEIRTAVRSTLAEGFGTCHCLCHGDLGNLDFLRKAGRALGDPELSATADHLAAGVLARIESAGPRCGGNTRNEIPGLLTGLAGIGYGLLQAAYPDRVPSVLLLETGNQFGQLSSPSGSSPASHSLRAS